MISSKFALGARENIRRLHLSMAPDGTQAVAEAMDASDEVSVPKQVVLDRGTSITVKPLYGVLGACPCVLLEPVSA